MCSVLPLRRASRTRRRQMNAATGRHKRRGMSMADSAFLRAHVQAIRVKQHTPEKYAAIKHELDSMRPDTTKQGNAKRASTRPATQGGAKSELPLLAAAPFGYTRWSTNQWCDAQACGVALRPCAGQQPARAARRAAVSAGTHKAMRSGAGPIKNPAKAGVQLARACFPAPAGQNHIKLS